MIPAPEPNARASSDRRTGQVRGVVASSARRSGPVPTVAYARSVPVTQAGLVSVRAALALGVITALSVASVSPAWAIDHSRAVETDADNTQSQVRLVLSEIRNTIARERRYPVDQRFVEAMLAYDRGNLPVASVLFYDLVWNPEFQRSTDYYEALYRLGASLYKQRNYRGAKRYLDQVLRRTGGPHFEDALQSLADIAIRLRNFNEVTQYASHLNTVPPGPRRSELVYQFGRSFLAASRIDDARKYLSQVGVGEKPWTAARFYLGALHVQDGKLEEARRAFGDVISASTSQDTASRPPQIVTDYAQIAVARIEMHEKRFKEAISAYLRIDRSSPLFEEALFELSACYVAAENPKAALGSLDLLLLTVSDDNLAVEAAVLRGRINLMLKEYDAADGSYKDVVDRFSAINGEMARFAQSSQLLEQFFTWLLHRGGEDYAVVRPVSERVARFVERDPDMGRVVALFDEMATEKRDVKQSARLAETLTVALQSNTRLETFPALRDKWLSLLEAENKLVAIGQNTIALLSRQGQSALSPDDRARAQGLMALNAKLYAAFQQMPATARAYNMRQTRIDSQMSEMAAQISLMRGQLTSQRDELQSIEKLLNDRLYGADAVNLSKDRENQIRAGLEEQRHEIRRIGREIDKLSGDVEVDATRLGSNDDINANESRLRAALLANQRSIQALYGSAMTRASMTPDQVQRLAGVRARIDQTLIEIAGGFREIDGRVREKTAEMTKVLEHEKGNIAEYQATVAEYEEESRRIARDIGFYLIRKAQGHLADIVLEADLGLVDVAWQRKQDKQAKVRELQDERAAKVKSLQNVLESLVGGNEAEEDEP